MALSQSDAQGLVRDGLLPELESRKPRLDMIDRWSRWEHDRPHMPAHATPEYTQLTNHAFTPWLGLVTSSIAQTLYVDGYRRENDTENMAAWRWWQQNHMDTKQHGIHRAALNYGYSFGVGMPGIDPDGNSVPVLRGVSPRRMVCEWEDEAADEWPLHALETMPVKRGGVEMWRVWLYDDEFRHEMYIDQSEGFRVEYIGVVRHGLGLCPVVRYTNMLDLEGRSPGEVEPNIPIAARINQTSFDRLVVQRFASWIVRTIAGMAQPSTEEAANLKKLQLKVEDLLVAEDPDTKFGSLPATPLEPFIKAKDSDIRDLAAVTQTPPHYLLGQMANLSAEALTAAETGRNLKAGERKSSFGESHESLLRLSARIAGDDAGWRDMSGQVQWRDVESRSLAQSADALGKLAQQLSVPVELLWEKIPGWNQTDVERAKTMVENGDGIQALLDAMSQAQASVSAPGPDESAEAL